MCKVFIASKVMCHRMKWFINTTERLTCVCHFLGIVPIKPLLINNL
jgi:hypothetical protein